MAIKRRNIRLLAAIVGLLLLTAAGFLAYDALTGGSEMPAVPADGALAETDDPATDDPATDEPETDEPETDDTVEDDGSSSPLIEPIDDAREVTDVINTSEGEAELLDELGLDATGQPADAQEGQPAGYEFSTTDAAGVSSTVKVDTTTGNYSVDSDDGSGFRLIDGASFARVGTEGGWDDVGRDDVQRFGITSLPTEATALPENIAPYASEVSREVSISESGDVETAVQRVDVASLRFEQPAELIAWASPFGLAGTDGDIVVTTVADMERGLRSFTLQSDGATVSYDVLATYDAATAISL